MLWKQRNAGVSEGENPSTNLLLSKIRKEAELWAKAGVKGLHVILPSTSSEACKKLLSMQ
jgi:hypothetical protein